MGEFVNLEVDDRRVGTIRLDRPPVNALNQQMWREIEEASLEAAEREDVGAVVVWGGGKTFAAGADIKEFPQRDHRTTREFGHLLRRSLDALYRLPKVTIAAVHGHALGGGCELAMACDFRYVADSAKLGQPEILLGLMPGAGGTQRLARLVGLSRAKDLVYSGRLLGAEEAHAWGLVDRVFPADELYDEACEAAVGFARGPYSLRLAKQALQDGSEQALDQGLRLESALFAECFATDDARIGIESFIERGPGKAEFTGR